MGLFGLGTGYLIYGPQELFGFPRRDASVDRATGIWGIWLPGFCQFVTGVYLFVALTWLGSLREPALYTAALAFSAYGIHWFTLGWNRYQGNDARPTGLMAIPFTIISVLDMVVFFAAGTWPVGILFTGLTAVYVSEFFIVAPGIGPSLGGYLVEYFSWRWIFYVNVPIGILGAIAAAMLLPRVPGGRAGRFDVLGFVTIAAGLFTLLLALSEGQTWGWSSYRILILFAVSLLSLTLFVVIELDMPEPLLDVRVFRSWPFANAQLLISVLSIGLFAVLFYIPLLLQQAMMLPPFPAGLILLPQALVMAVLMPISGRLYDRIGPRWLAVSGLLIVALGTYQMRHIGLDTSHEHMIWLLAFRAVGLGLCIMPIFTVGMSSVPLALTNQASAFSNVVRQTSSALGVAAFTALVTRQ